jgi:hypothetical protein
MKKLASGRGYDRRGSIKLQRDRGTMRTIALLVGVGALGAFAARLFAQREDPTRRQAIDYSDRVGFARSPEAMRAGVRPAADPVASPIGSAETVATDE